jgi:hypothetical protein
METRKLNSGVIDTKDKFLEELKGLEKPYLIGL